MFSFTVYTFEVCAASNYLFDKANMQFASIENNSSHEHGIIQYAKEIQKSQQ